MTELMKVDGEIVERKLRPADAVAIANELKEWITQQGMAKNLNPKQPDSLYVFAPGWKALGSMLGYHAECDRPTEDESGRVWCKARIVQSAPPHGNIGHGEGCVSPDESLWKGRPFAQRQAMAQTRAISRAYRNCLDWVMETAGFESTPAEEWQTEDAQRLEVVRKPTIVEETAQKWLPPEPAPLGDEVTYVLREIDRCGTVAQLQALGVKIKADDAFSEAERQTLRERWAERKAGL